MDPRWPPLTSLQSHVAQGRRRFRTPCPRGICASATARTCLLNKKRRKNVTKVHAWLVQHCQLTSQCYSNLGHFEHVSPLLIFLPYAGCTCCAVKGYSLSEHISCPYGICHGGYCSIFTRVCSTVHYVQSTTFTYISMRYSTINTCIK